ncbi:MAG: class I SAM-dependent methyltransferase [Planctomycetes bacterium]|nr:class I SAM-dependent methyltransferase [Planctomycetota bacterium]
MTTPQLEVSCRASDSTELETILDYGQVPLADVLLPSNDPEVEDARFPLRLVFCPESALVQITGDVPPEILWGGDYPYYTSVNPTLVKHFTDGAHAIMARQPLGPDSLVIEAASNDGYQLAVFQAAGSQVLGVDPAEGPCKVANEKGIETHCRLFDAAMAEELAAAGKQADVITGNNLLNLIPDPKEFTACVDKLLKPDGLVVLEVPYLVDTIDMVAFDNMFHQNVTYWTATSLQRLFARAGMELVDVEAIDTFGGSLRVYFRRGGQPSAAVQEILAQEKAQAIRDTLRARLIELHGQKKRIVAYGAAGGMATVLLSFLDLPEGVLEYAVDISPHKHGRWTSGYRLEIFPPEHLAADRPDYALLLAWNFEPQVLEQRADFRATGGRFIIPIPEVRIV